MARPDSIMRLRLRMQVNADLQPHLYSRLAAVPEEERNSLVIAMANRLALLEAGIDVGAGSLIQPQLIPPTLPTASTPAASKRSSEVVASKATHIPVATNDGDPQAIVPTSQPTEEDSGGFDPLENLGSAFGGKGLSAFLGRP